MFDAGHHIGITWNTPSATGLNIIGGLNLGGNYWAKPDGTGWSQTHRDDNGDGFSDDVFPILSDGININHLPLAYAGVVARFTADPSEGKADETHPLIVQFTDQSTGTIQSWSWNFDDGTTSDEQNPSHEFTSPGLYWVTLTVTESGTGLTSSCGHPVSVTPEIPEGVPIWQGWNFVSVPKTLQAGNNTAGVVFAGVEKDDKPVWKYDAAGVQWVRVYPGDVLVPLEGYWVYSSAVGPYVPYHYSTVFGGTAPGMKHLPQGWNAIGMGSVYTTPTGVYLGSLGDSWSMLLEYDSGTQVYYPPQVNGVNTWGMQPTRGYWIYMKEPADLIAVTG